MKILAQTHRMPHDRVEHEYEAIKRSGHEYVSYGYKTGRHGITDGNLSSYESIEDKIKFVFEDKS